MRVFFIGVCGTAMGNAAVLLKKMGHEVAGSDAGVYPPMSDVLESAGIELFEGFAEQDMLTWQPDRVVVGNAVSRGNPQVEYLLRTREIDFVSLPQLIGEDLIGNRPAVVVAGTHGKTTTTALTSYALSHAGQEPGYLIGGVPIDLPSGNELGGSASPFVIEGDEYDSAFFDKRSKFIHYRPKVLVLNNLEFDHGDIFRDLQDISRSFSHLLRIVPSNGFVLRNGDDPNLLALPDAPWTRIISVGVGDENDFRIVDFTEDGQGTRFKLSWLGATVMEVSWNMPGLFNARNLAMATLAFVLFQQIYQADEPFDIISDNTFSGVSLPDFSECAGVKRRQEILHDSEKLVVLSDFAHHPTAIAGALESLRARWPGREIIACFEPRSNTAVTNVFEDRFADALTLADVAFLGAVHRADKIPPDQRINTSNMIRRIERKGKQGHAFPTNLDLESFLLKKEITQPSLLVFFSNGSFDGVIGRFADAVKKR
ncbi:MAG: Mur ligase family protein [Verrucomicrobiota bacterium]|nr:Mur ligase family protein [Verrucomicrobiota bacterium]